MEPQGSSYKTYLVTHELPSQVNNESGSHNTTIIKDETFDILKTENINSKEEESFLFNYIGKDGLYVCLKTALKDFFSKTNDQTLLVFMDVLNSASIKKKIADIFDEETTIHEINNLQASAFEIASDNLTDFVSGVEAASLNEVDFTYFNYKMGKLGEILKFFKNRQRSGWQAFIIRINYAPTSLIEKIFNIVFLNPDLSVGDESKNIPVNRSLTVILNCHYETQLNCAFTQFIYSFTNASIVSAVVDYPSEELEFMRVKTILFHTCFKYINSSDLLEIMESQTKTTKYIKKLRSKVAKIEKETRANLVTELSQFYFQQYSVLQDNYIKALSQVENTKCASEHMKTANLIFNHSTAVQNFTELGDCSSKVKGLVYLMFESERQFQCIITMNNELLKNKKRFEEYLEVKNESMNVLKKEREDLKKEKERLLRIIEIKDMEKAEEKQKMYRVVKHYQRAIEFYQKNHAQDQEIIKANRKETHSLLRYVNRIRKKEVYRKTLKHFRTISRQIDSRRNDSTLPFKTTKSCILERISYEPADELNSTVITVQAAD